MKVLWNRLVLVNHTPKIKFSLRFKLISVQHYAHCSAMTNQAMAASAM